MWNAAARLGIKTQSAVPWGKEVVASLRLTSLGNTVLGLAERFCFSSPNKGRQTSLILAMSCLSPHANNSGECPLTHSTSQDLKTKCKWSFQSPFLTAVFPLLPNDTLMPHTMELVYARDVHISLTREWPLHQQHICWITAPHEEQP